ncbi:Octanoyltransferase LipM [bacterium HR36]|nr:Octanoyltransferase LipM [bacterium HR36]
MAADSRAGQVCCVRFNTAMRHKIRLLPTLTADGARQMALDEVLLEQAERGFASCRIYFWDRPTLSLGYFQSAAEREAWPELSHLPVVRRMTGGGAIVHGSQWPMPLGGLTPADPLPHSPYLTDWTYALALPARLVAGRPASCWHDEIHQALCGVLRRFGIDAHVLPRAGHCQSGPQVTVVARAPLLIDEYPKSASLKRWEEPEASLVGSPTTASDRVAPDGPGQGARAREFLCFDRPAPGDVVRHGRKIVGSAQRLRRGALLQHGSILLPRGLCDVTAWAQLWLAELGWDVEPVNWSPEELAQAERWASERYRQDHWNFRR